MSDLAVESRPAGLIVVDSPAFVESKIDSSLYGFFDWHLLGWGIFRFDIPLALFVVTHDFNRVARGVHGATFFG